MTPNDFIAKWKNGGDERRDAQPFFEDLCRLIGHQTPKEADPHHTWFTYEYGAAKTNGGDGWADVWKQGKFGWEAKGTHKNLNKAYEQLKMYADSLENPPLLVVSDLQTIIVHTNFTSTVKKTYTIKVEDLHKPENLRILNAVFNDPDQLRPGITRKDVTTDAAKKFTSLATSLGKRYPDPRAVAHFLNRLIFCMFAEDILLLPNKVFTRMVEASQNKPDVFEQSCGQLFEAMRAGGNVAFENIDWFNGGLFEDDATLRLNVDELELLKSACIMDWDEIEPSIFGTLFERGLDPDKRSKAGVHYTDPATILKIVGPVVIEPWEQEWAIKKAELVKMLAKAKKTVSPAANKAFTEFLERLRNFRVLDPACGSGNFLYMSLRALKDLEKKFIDEGEAIGLQRPFPGVGPACVKGIELSSYAAELARITIWIGEIQWMIQNGYGANKNPILQPLNQIEHRDALLNPDGTRAAWPDADVIVGNPPFIGNKKLLLELGDDYVATLRAAYGGRISDGTDFVCYWFEHAKVLIQAGKLRRAGLVATNSIRGGQNRLVLQEIADQSRIFNAWSDEPWVNEGADVRVSMVSFGHGDQEARLNGQPVTNIFADLTGEVGGVGIDVTKAGKLKSNKKKSFQGSVKVGKFDITGDVARKWLLQPNAVAGPNSEVLRPLSNAKDITGRSRGKWIVDFNDKGLTDAEGYELPFEHVEKNVKAARAKNRDDGRREKWWLHGRVGTDIRAAVKGLDRVLVTPRVAKHRLFVWQHPRVYCDDATVTIARNDDTSFGILHSRFHEVWALRMGTELGVGNDPRYTPGSCFETFPFPEGLTPDIEASDYAADPRAVRISNAAKALNDAREQWLKPPLWCDLVPEVQAGYPDRVVAKAGHAADLAKRTLTNLYNAKQAWLVKLHLDLDVAVADAYGWPWPMTDDDVLKNLFALNQARATKPVPKKATKAKP